MIISDYINMVISWINLPSNMDVGSTLTEFILPVKTDLESIDRPLSEYYCLVDGKLVARERSDSDRTFDCFISNCNHKILTLQEKVHHISFVLPYNDGYIMLIKCIRPFVDGEQIEFDENNLLMTANTYEKEFMSSVNQVVLLCEKENEEEVLPQCIMRVNSDTFDLPENYFTYTGDVTVDYGDGTVESYDGSAINHTYSISGLYEVIIYGSITSLLANSLSENMKQNLVHITIPNGVTQLGGHCFQSCSGLTSVVMPSSVTSLGGWCFENCSSLTDIVIPSSVTSLGDRCFQRCSSLTDIVIPSSVTTLSNFCFVSCSNLTSVTISDGVTTLGANCFLTCSGLTSITIPQSVTTIQGQCFNHCYSLTNITIPSSVTSIGYQVFHHCDNLTILFEWNTSDNILSYNSDWFDPSPIKIKIPQGTTSIYTGKGYPTDKLLEVQ